MTSINLTLRTGALDHFDTIFANNQEQVNEIREIEKLRNTKKKNIVEVGFPLMDDLIKEYNEENCKSEENTILIAPSYQEDNIIESCINEILEQLLDTKYKIIVRPHPQFIQRNPEKIAELTEKYKSKFNDKFYFELDFLSNKNIYSAGLVITDWSGIGMEYSLATTKPTLYINTDMKVINKDYKKINIEPIDIIIRNDIGKVIEKEDIRNIKNIIYDITLNKQQYKEKNIETRNKYLFNVCKSSKIAGEYIINKIKKEGEKNASDNFSCWNGS